ncbi:MAG: hypothetical protein JO089_02020 [Alphaproteobacteria bacterium]|nr:hypothetical protein [Alphaproteobacteria bacterium]
MDTQELKGGYDVPKAKLQTAWSRLTESELDAFYSDAASERNKFYAAVERHYGLTRDEVDKQTQNIKTSHPSDTYAA